MPALEDILSANRRYAETFDMGSLPIPPGRKLAVITCMDARINTASAFGLKEGDAHVIRNAGGRVSEDALRSLVISQQLLGTTSVVVIHHTDCGMVSFTNEQLREKVKDQLGVDTECLDYMPFTDLEQSVRDDVEALKSSKLLMPGTDIFGCILDVHTGRIREVK